MNCPNCGADIAPTSARCEYCGRTQERPQPEPQRDPDPPVARLIEVDREGLVCRNCGHQGEPVLERRLSATGVIVTVVLVFACLPLFFIPLLMPQFREQSPRCARCRAWLHPLFGNVQVRQGDVHFGS